ncbi:MAG: hypothetical protein OXC80_04185 [Gammaproteobacteria bacterium]|nr:hypothetical protein [Gammaproteobacteria bacterium]
MFSEVNLEAIEEAGWGWVLCGGESDPQTCISESHFGMGYKLEENRLQVFETAIEPNR